MFNYTDAQRARSMRRRRVSEETIHSFFKGKYTPTDLDGLITELRLRNRKAAIKCYQGQNYKHLLISDATKIAPPQEVLDQRDRRQMLWPKTLTAFFCGDPLPGESALDRRSM